MSNTNASPTIFGFDFQVNAAIVLMLENIKDLKKLRLEGKTEDIELTMNNGKKIFAQAKSVVKASTDFNNVRSNLKKAISTLSNADGNDVDKLILITNSVNPLNEEKSKGFFWGPPSDIGYSDLPDEGKEIIDNKVQQLGVKLDTTKFRIKFFRFETDNENERYKTIRQMITDFVISLGIGRDVSATDLMNVWQKDIFKNGSKTNVKILLDKEQLIWPIIVLSIGKQIPTEYLDDYDFGLAEEIAKQYSDFIDNCSEKYELVTQVLYDFKQFDFASQGLTRKQGAQRFIDYFWKDYVDVLTLKSLDNELQEGVSKLVISKIIQQRFTIDVIKQGVSL